MTTPSKELSPFGQAALKLENDFSELESLGGQLERLEICSDFGFERAKQLLERYAECGKNVATGVQALAQALETSRATAERSAALVSDRAAVIQRRNDECQAMSSRFAALGQLVRALNEQVTGVQTADGISEDETAEKISAIVAEVERLAEEANVLRKDAREANMKNLERNAETLAQSLYMARQKLGAWARRGGTVTAIH